MTRLDVNYATVASFERAKEPERERNTSHLFTVVLMAVFFVALMGGLAVGATMYRSVVDSQAAADDNRMVSGLLASNIHVSDALDAVEMGEGPEGPALVLVQRLASGTYETRIYQHGSQIVQEYAVQGASYNPERATPLVNSYVFEFSYRDGLITITTDRNSYSIALRSAQTGAHATVGFSSGDAAGAGAAGAAAAGAAGDAASALQEGGAA